MCVVIYSVFQIQWFLKDPKTVTEKANCDKGLLRECHDNTSILGAVHSDRLYVPAQNGIVLTPSVLDM